jgi:hypothetical protein
LETSAWFGFFPGHFELPVAHAAWTLPAATITLPALPIAVAAGIDARACGEI